MMDNKRKYGILACGELLIDIISLYYADTFDKVEDFKRIMGGSPANLAMNMARLGVNVRLAACVGYDDMGNYLLKQVKKLGVNCDLITQVDEPTTLILVTRSKAVSNFQAYRGADFQINETQFSDEYLKECSIFHTTCFALSKNPAQNAIIKASERAVHLGCQLSIDANYEQTKIWKDQAEAQKIVAQYCSHGAFVKISEVDWQRLYNQKLTDANEAIDKFLNLGASEVCVTLGGDGCMIGSNNERHFVEARPVAVNDTTGAGDAFWSGYLTARLDGYNLLNSAIAGRRMAELKLQHFGPLPEKVDRKIVYEDFSL